MLVAMVNTVSDLLAVQGSASGAHDQTETRVSTLPVGTPTRVVTESTGGRALNRDTASMFDGRTYRPLGGSRNTVIPASHLWLGSNGNSSRNRNERPQPPWGKS